MNYLPQLLIDELDAALLRLGAGSRFLVGLSGGLDSVVLLHAMAQLRARSTGEMELRAIHVDHQLHPDSASWARFCETLCASLDIDFLATEVSIDPDSGVENAARAARYREFESTLRSGEELLLAHHRDDQMETLLLRLMRGAGSRGMSGIPHSRDLGRGRLLRPLIEVDRDELRRYAEVEELNWIEDASNADESFDRNYCRHKLLPLIEARWPAYRESWSKSAALAGESEALLQELAAMDLQEAATPSAAVLDRGKVLSLTEPRQRNLLRYWIAQVAGMEMGWSQLQRLSNEVLLVEGGRFIADGLQVHCYRDGIHILSEENLARMPEQADEFPLAELPSLDSVALKHNGSLRISRAQGEGLALERLEEISVRYRQGGESCKLVGRPSKTLKKILQEAGTPPWLRGRQPLLYSGESLACIPGIGVCEDFVVAAGETGYLVDWRRPDFTPGS